MSGKHPADPSDREAEAKLLRRLEERAQKSEPLQLVKADAAVLTGLPAHKAEAALSALSRDYRSHIAVTEQGDLVYRFSPGLTRRDARTFAERVQRAAAPLVRAAWGAFKLMFKVWISVTLVGYTILFALIALALSLASEDDGPSGLIWWWILPDFGRARDPYAQERPRKRFHRSVFDFVFGPPPTQGALPRSRDELLLSYIRDKQGRVTASELALLLGCDYQRAEEEATRLLCSYDGEPEVAEDGTLIYTFRDLRRTALPAAAEKDPPPALPAADEVVQTGRVLPFPMGELGRDQAGAPMLLWGALPMTHPAHPYGLARLRERGAAAPARVKQEGFAFEQHERRQALTGNSGGANFGIGALNTFNLLAALTLGPWFAIAAGLGALATVLLTLVPLLFSAIFFAVPLGRYVALRREHGRIERRNVRRALLWAIHERGGEPTEKSDLIQAAADRLIEMAEDPAEAARKHARQVAACQKELERLLIELDGDVTAEGVYAFPRLRSERQAALHARKRAEDSEQHLGEVVFSSDSDGPGA